MEKPIRGMIQEEIEMCFSKRLSTLQKTTPASPKPNRWLRDKEAADYLGVSRSTIHNWVRQRIIRKHFIGGVARYDRYELDDKLVGQTVKTGGAAC